MDFWRKILILAIVILFSYILWRLLARRNEILFQQSQQALDLNKENFTGIATPVSIGNLNINALTTTNGITDPVTAKKLKQFVIKASYHTCYDGSDLSAGMVQYALKRGYRWLDFCTSDGINVCYTTDDTKDGVTTTGTPVSFSGISDKINQNAFISSESPNAKDPLFIQIRPLWDPSDSEKNNALNVTISGLQNKFVGTIDANTTIDQLLGKVVVVVDKSRFTSATGAQLHSNDNTFMTSKPIAEATSLDAGLPLILADNFTTKPPNKIYQFLPTGANGNSDVYSLIQRIGVQITPMCLWSNDTHLANYEAIFDNARAGIVPLSTVLRYTKENDPNSISSSYPGAFSGK